MKYSSIVKNYTTVDTVSTVNLLLEHIGKYEVLAIDTETTGLNVRKESIIGWSICGLPGESYYMPTWKWDTNTNKLVKLYIDGKDSEELSKRIIKKLKGKKLVAHNASFDFRIIKNYYGIDLLEDLWVDTGMLVHTVQEEGAFGYGSPFALKSIALMNQEILGLDMESAANEEQVKLKESVHKNGGSTTKANFEIYKADLDILCEYGAADTDLTLRICNLYLEKLYEEGLEKFFFEDEVMPIYKEVTVPMENRGIKLDMELLQETDVNITEDLKKYKKAVIDSIVDLDGGRKWIIDKSLENFPPSNKGSWAQNLCMMYSLDLPKTASGKYSLTAKNIEKLDESPVKQYLLTGNLDLLKVSDVGTISMQMWKDSNDGDPINIQSTSHLSDLIFNYLGEDAMDKTASGRDKFDIETLDYLAKKYVWAENLQIFNKLSKIKSTYVDRFLNKNDDGHYYFYFKQNGTVSGRYGSDMQQLPRRKEEGEAQPIVLKYNNLVRAFLIARSGYSFIDDDYSSLEPRVFAHVANDPNLKKIFNEGLDFYSHIAIQTEKLEGVSAHPKDSNFLKKVQPVKRQNAKAYCFTRDTLVNTVRGMVPISNIVLDDMVYTRDGLKPVTNLFKRDARVLKFHTNIGTLECTPDHKIWNGSEWKEASKFTKGEHVFIDNNVSDSERISKLPIYSNMSFSKGATRPIGDLEIDEEWSYFIGAMLGDGIISIKHTENTYGHGLKGYVGICGIPDDGVIDKIDGFLISLGFPMSSRKQKGNCLIKTVVNSELCKIVYDTLGLGDMMAKKRTKNLKVPDYMFNQPVQSKLAFIAGLLDTDGYVKNLKNTRVAAITSKDSRLTTGLINLLHSLGIKARYEPQWNKTYQRYYYTLKIPVPSMVILKELGIQKYMVVERKRMAFETAVSLCKRSLKPAAFIALEDLGETKEVFDITVADSHEFYANGILVHNCLGIPYGLGAFALGKTLDIPTKEAESLVNGYLEGFPELSKWMENSKIFVKANGYINIQTGRRRHLPKVKKIYDTLGESILDWNTRKDLESRFGKEKVDRTYLDYKNGVNNSLNVQIQSLSASIVNRAALAINRKFKELGIDGLVVAQVHDQLICEVLENDVESSMEIVQYCMENTTKLDGLKLIAVPEVAKNMAEGH